MKKIDGLWDGKIKPGFEMLVDNFSAGILGALMAVFGLFVIGPVVLWFIDAPGRVVDFAGQQRPAAAHLDLHRARQGPVPQQRHQPRRPDPAGHPAGAAPGKSILFLLEANPGPGFGILLAYIALRQGHGQGLGPGRRDHPVRRRHPRDLLPVRADEAAADPRHDRRRHDRHLHQRHLRLGLRAPAAPGLDHRGLRADAPGQLPRCDPVGHRRRRGVVRDRRRPAARSTRATRGRGRPRRATAGWSDEGQEVRPSPAAADR